MSQSSPPLSRVVTASSGRNRPQRRRFFSRRPCIVVAGITIWATIFIVTEMLSWIQQNNSLGDGSATSYFPLPRTGGRDTTTSWVAEQKRNTVHRKVNDQASKRAPLTKHDNKQHQKPLVLPSDFKGLNLLSNMNDPVYQWGSWDESPIVIESHRLLFFTIPKVGCTVFKQLFRRMYGYHNWKEHNDFIPHHPMSNGLNYLYHYKPQEAERMLTDPSWTRAIFFRDPKERLLSAYLDKGLHENGKYVRVHCCGNSPTLKTLLHCQVPVNELPNPLLTFVDFLEQIVPHCQDPHWRPQAHRLPDAYWPYINFVGHMDHIENDAKRLLQKIGAWDEFGARGWESGAIFTGAASVAHATGARQRVSSYYKSVHSIRLAERLHKVDYEHPVVSIPKR